MRGRGEAYLEVADYSNVGGGSPARGRQQDRIVFWSWEPTRGKEAGILVHAERVTAGVLHEQGLAGRRRKPR